MDGTPFAAQILLIVTGLLEKTLTISKRNIKVLNSCKACLWFFFLQEFYIASFTQYVFEAFKFLQYYKIKAYIQKRKKDSTHTRLTFPFHFEK